MHDRWRPATRPVRADHQAPWPQGREGRHRPPDPDPQLLGPRDGEIRCLARSSRASAKAKLAAAWTPPRTQQRRACAPDRGTTGTLGWAPGGSHAWRRGVWPVGAGVDRDSGKNL